MKKHWKWIVASVLLSTFVLSVSGCSKKAAKGINEEKVEWMSLLHTASPPSNKILDKIEEKTGSKIDFTWVPDASKEEKINAALASDTLKEITTLAYTQMNNSQVRSALQAGQFWEVEDYLKDFPNLKKISSEHIKAAKIDGKLYGVPIQKPMARYGVAVRQDWLDNLGMDVPHTTEELMAVAKAFTEKDPAGDGTKTIGFAERSEAFDIGFRYLSGIFGAPELWTVENNKAIPAFMTSEYLNAMEYFKELYQKGYMNSDFAVTAKNDQLEYAAQGKAGIVILGLQDVANNLLSIAPKEQLEKMQWTMINDLTAPGVDRRVLSDTKGGMGGLLAFPKSIVKDEDHLKRLLKFVDQLLEEDIWMMMTYGVEDEQYKLRDGNIVEIIDQKAWEQDVQPLLSSRPSEVGYDVVNSDPIRAEAEEKIKENAKFAVTNPLQGLDSPTDIKEGSQLMKEIEDAFYKYVMGDIELQGWQDAVKKWQKNGGDRIIIEYTESYEKVSN